MLKMVVKETDNFLNRIRYALTLPIRNRCAELTVLFDRGSILELQNFFPILIDNIFGPQGTLSWGLRTTTASSKIFDDDFTQLQHFLSPNGPLFKLIYNLLKDSSAKYDFPLAYLPRKVQLILENAQNHPFYADLVHVNPQTKRVISLLLNPFDYYIFHFAYHLINPWHQRSVTPTTTTTPNVASWNTVYYVLCCDYMLHFLPTDPNVGVSPVIFYNGKNPMQHTNLNENFKTGTNLINSSILNKSLEEFTYNQSYGKHPRNEIWRSETVLTVFIDMWLNNDQINQPITQINSSFNNSQINSLLNCNELPSAEYMRIVRVLIKQLHSFSQSAKFDPTSMCELKKIAIPMVQGKFYIFLRNLIHRWPLDGSFRLVLELWLSYIQPWRYPPTINNTSTVEKTSLNNADMDEVDIKTSYKVEREHLPFIAENLLVYVVIFQQLLPRFSRVDLVSPKIAVMLYRISKVYNQPNLGNFLKEIEQSVENNSSPIHSYSNHWSTNLPPLNPTSNWCTNISVFMNSTQQQQQQLFNTSMSNDNTFGTSPRKVTFQNDLNGTTFMNTSYGDKKWSAIVKQRIYELEGPNFYYKPLFTNPPAIEVYELIIQIKKSIKVAQELVEIQQQEEKQFYKGFWSFFRQLWEIPTVSDEFSLNERIKVPAYLDVSLQNLMELFSINELPESSNQDNSSGQNSALEMTNDYKFLTPKNVRERIKKIKYEGDPDLHPIRSTEIAFLVRMFYQIAQLINDNYGTKFCQLYYNPNYMGRLSRQFLLPPMTVYKFDKSKLGSPRVSTDLPPRISFRRFATHRFIFYLVLGAVIFNKVLGYSLFSYILTLFSVSFLYKCLKAIPKTQTRHIYPTQGFGNISFNDSF